jgi:hypothetical protein
MIQRRQSIFLFLQALFGILLLFVPVENIDVSGTNVKTALVTIQTPGFSSSAAHIAAALLNFACLAGASITIFLYKQRTLQLNICYVLAVLWLVLAALMVLSSFIVSTDTSFHTTKNYFTCVLPAAASAFALVAAKYIKKDIELLRSADRIR